MTLDGSMTKEQFIAQVEKNLLDEEYTKYTAEWIWDNLLYEGERSMKVKPWWEFESEEEKAEREMQLYLADQQRRADIREKVILRQMERTGQDRATVERLLP